ncbi:hypothetical protein E4T56_gene2181, partial [Termitomyces sp. T112]
DDDPDLSHANHSNTLNVYLIKLADPDIIGSLRPLPQRYHFVIDIQREEIRLLTSCGACNGEGTCMKIGFHHYA